jgi:hypothetical protein
MTITKPKKLTADAFIAAAPDARPRGVRKGNKLQITLTIAPTLLARVDELASQLCQSRAAVINLAILRAVEHGLSTDGLQKS